MFQLGIFCVGNTHFSVFNIMSTAPLVTDMTSASRWPIHFIDAVRTCTLASTDLMDRLHSRLTISVSTAFSGICAPSTALHMLFAPLSHFCHSSVNITYKFAIEWSGACQDELRCLPTPPRCIHSNILAFCTDETHRIIDNAEKEAGDDGVHLDIWEATFIHRPNAVTLDTECTNHNCSCSLSSSWLHVAGIPCTDYSSIGKGKGLAGITAKFLFTWIALMLRLRPFVLVLENVTDFPYEIIAKFLWMYKYEELVLSNEFFGFAVARTRKYCLFTLVQACRLEFPLSFLPDLLGRTRSPAFTWNQSFMAEQAEQVAEARALRRRKGSIAHGRVVDIDDPNMFEESLSQCETKHLASFRALHPHHDSVFTLSQNAQHRDMSSGKDVLQTITASAAMLWNDRLGRWATSRECLGMQGFPVYDQMVTAFFDGHPLWPVSSFNVARARCGLGPRVRGSMMHQAGNSMHTAVVGSVLLWALAFITTTDTSIAVPVPRPMRSPSLTSLQVDVCDDGGFDSALVRLRRPAGRRSISSDLSDAASGSSPVSISSSVVSVVSSCDNDLFDAMLLRLGTKRRRLL